MERSRGWTASVLGLLFALVIAVLGVWALLDSNDPLSDSAASANGPSTFPTAASPSVDFDELPAATTTPRTPGKAAGIAPTGSTTPTQSNRSVEQKEEEEDRGPAVVRGQVVDRSGYGAAEATVVLRAWRRGEEDQYTRTPTDLQGRFELQVESGRYGLWAEKEGLAPSEVRYLRLRGGEAKTLDPLLLTASTALRGSVDSVSGEPLSGARITLALRSGRDREVTTDAEGRFVVDGLREALYMVTASKTGFVPQTESDVPVTEEVGGEVAFRLAPAGTVSGLLRRPDGTLLADGLVFAYREDRPVNVARSDEQGRYRLAALAAGPVELFARSKDSALSVRSRAMVIPGQPVIQDLILMKGPRIEGVLRNAEGDPLEKVRVIARAKIGNVFRQGESDAEGHYVVENLYPGEYELTVGGGRGGEGARLRTRVEVTSGDVRRDLVVPESASVAGRVVDAQGEAVEGAMVFAIVGARFRGNTTSDAEGRFQMADLAADDYQLFVRVGDDQKVGQLPVLLEEGKTLEDLEVVVRAPASLRGRILDPQGQPLPGVVVTVRASDAPVWRQAKSKEDGSFLIPTLYDGHYELKAEEGPLLLLARKWGVSAVRLEPFEFAITQCRDEERDLRVRVQE